MKGALFVSPTTDNIETVFARGRVLRVGDREARIARPEMALTVAEVRDFKGGLIVHFEELDDRNAAEQFRGRTLLIPVDEAEPLAAGEYYLHDLVDLEVRDASGNAIGRVREIYTVGSSLLLGVDDGGRERLVPFSQRIVREVDLEKGTIVIEPPPGLLEL